MKSEMTSSKQPEAPNWVVIEAASDESVHVCPNYGRPHSLQANCWCGPTCEKWDKDLYIHHPAN